MTCVSTLNYTASSQSMRSCYILSNSSCVVVERLHTALQFAQVLGKVQDKHGGLPETGESLGSVRLCFLSQQLEELDASRGNDPLISGQQPPLLLVCSEYRYRACFCGLKPQQYQ